MTYQEELDSIYERLGGNEPVTAAILDRIKQLENLINPPPQPLSFEQWCYDVDIEAQYQALYDEYGDAAAPLWSYKQYHYLAYLEEFKRNSLTS